MKYIQQGVLESKEERQKFRHAPRFAPAGQSTQVIVGATSESDKDILFLSSALYGRHHETCLLLGLRFREYV